MPSRVLARAVAVLIVSVTAGCDNVVWGGTDIQIVPPPPPFAEVVETDAQAFGELGLPRGPVIFHLVQEEGQTRLIPVAEVAGDQLRAVRRPADVSEQAYEGRFRETVIPVGAQFDVFRRGSRVGTFVAHSEGPINACGVPTVVGNATVVAAAVGADDYLVFRQGLAPTGRGEFSPPQVTGPIRTYASIVAERLILQAGLPRPRSWSGAQAELQPVEIMAGGHPEMAATYLVGDNLQVGPGDPNGYSVFYLADYETQRGYMPVYTEVRDYRQTGKAAPRLIDYVDWDGDGNPELLLEVYGREGSWYQAIAQRGGEWQRIFEGERC